MATTKTKKASSKTGTKKYGKKATNKIQKTMHEWGKGELHSGSKSGPKVKSQKQAVAIGISQARKAGAKVPKKSTSSRSTTSRSKK